MNLTATVVIPLRGSHDSAFSDDEKPREGTITLLRKNREWESPLREANH